MSIPDRTTDLVYGLGSTRLLLRPFSGPPSGRMKFSTTESTLWTSQSSCNGDSFTTSLGFRAKPKEAPNSAPASTHKYRMCCEGAKPPNLDSNPRNAIANVKFGHRNHSRLVEYMQNNLENEVGSPGSIGATAVSPRVSNRFRMSDSHGDNKP